MKTPREIVLERHRTATPKLNAIRRETLRTLNNEASKEPSYWAAFVSSLLRCSTNVWRELILPSCRIWMSLAAIWILLLAVNISQRDRSPDASMKSAQGPVMILSFREQEKMLNELMGPDESRAAAPVKLLSPQPSSQRRFEILTA